MAVAIHEFMALSAIGEDTIVYSKSDYAANIEKAEVVYEPNHKHTTVQPIEKLKHQMLRLRKNWQTFR